jgi:hypothetical protein
MLAMAARLYPLAECICSFQIPRLLVVRFSRQSVPTLRSDHIAVSTLRIATAFTTILCNTATA